MNRKCILRVTALLFATLPLLGPTHVALADVVKVAGPKEVRAALKEFSRASKAKSAAERMDAVRALASVHHEKATVRLVKFTRSEDDPEVLAVAFEALAGHKPFAKRIVPALADRIADEARREHKRMSRGDAGIRIDPRSGDPDVKSPDGLKRLRATELRSRMLTSLLRTLNALEWTPRRKTPDLTPFLQDASDDLVVAVLTWMGRTNVTTAIPALLELFRMYPTEVSWETGAVHDIGGTDATAKAKWMVRFGHPEKQRARPKVFEALHETLKTLTGRTFEEPKALAAWLQTADAKKRMRSTRKR